MKVITAQHYDSALVEIKALTQTLATLPAYKTVIVVSNEVGLGIVPAYALGRVYRDVLGPVNQQLARASPTCLSHDCWFGCRYQTLARGGSG